MTNAKSTKRALLTSVVSLILCFTMLLGTTFAWFTDSVTSANNVIQSGNLDIELDYWDGDSWETVEGTNSLFTNNLWEPGHTEVVYLKLSNLGSLALKYQLAISVLSETEGTNMAGDPFKLSKYIQMGVVENVNGETNAYADREAAVDAVKANSGIIGDGYAKHGNMLEGDPELYMAVVVYMPETVDNEANAMTGTDAPIINLGVQVLATQYTAEGDSFGDQYDKEAWVSGMAVYTAEDLQAAINAGETSIKLMDDIALDAPIVIPASATTFSMRSATPATVIDLNGKTITGNVGRDADGNRVHVIVNNGNAVIKNGVITSAGVNGGSAIYNADGATLTVENVTLNGAPQEGSTWPSYTVNNYGTLTVSDSSIYGVQGIIATNNTANTTVNNVIAYRDGWSSGHVFYTTSSTAKVTINGGTYTNDGNGVDGTMIYGGETVVNGGTFIVKEGAYFALCSGSKLTVNGGDFSNIKSCLAWGGAMTISGGTFGFNPTTYVADGFQAVENNGTYYVVADGIDAVVATPADLAAAIAQGGTVYVAADLDMNNAWTSVKPTAALTILGNGNVITNLNLPLLAGGVSTTVTFKGLTVADSNVAPAVVENGLGTGAFIPYVDAYGNVSFEDCHLVNTTVTGNERAGGFIGYTSGQTLSFKDCTVDGCEISAVGGAAGLVAYSQTVTVIDGCSVTNTKVTATEDRLGTKSALAGSVIGTVNADTTISKVTASGNTVSNNNALPAFSNEIGRKVAGTLTIDGKTVVLVQSGELPYLTLNSNATYMLTGDFGGQNVSLVMPVGVENVIFDGSEATNINELIIVQNGKIIDNANDPIGERSGNVTVQNFNVLSQINVFACKTEVVVQKNNAEALMIHAGNCAVKVLNNTIDANFESHPTYRDANNTWNTNNYGIALNIFDYNLWLDGNTVTDAIGHAIGINGWEGTIDNGDENVIESFKGNTITVNSTSNNKRAAFKVWDDETYASNDDDTNVINATAQAFIDAVLADGSNTFNIVDGYNHTIFGFYNVNTNN